MRYFLKCNELDNDPYQKDTFLISGVDKNVLLKTKQIILNDIQERQVLNYIRKYDAKKIQSEYNNLVLSFLLIEENEKKYIV